MLPNVIVSSIVFVVAAAVLPTFCHALEIHKDGYEIEIFFKEKSDGLHVWGNVDEGGDCRQLNVTIFLKNSDSAETARVVSAIRNYGGSRAVYKGIDEVYRGGKRKSWFVDSVFTKCLN